PEAITGLGEVPRRLLLIRPDHLGDVLWLTPALRALRQHYPPAEITVAIGPWSKPILSDNCDYDTLLTLDFPGFTRRPKGNPLAPYKLLRETAQGLRADHFDAALILRDDHWWGGLLAAMAGIPRRIGFAHPDVAPFLTDALPLPSGEHTALGNLRLIDAFLRLVNQPALSHGSIEAQRAPLDHPLVFVTPEAAERHAATLLASLDKSRPIVAIHASAGVPVKLWDERRLALVADRLAEEYSAQIILTGSKGDEGLTGAVAAAMATTPPLDLTGRTNIPELTALYRHCALVIGPDSGALHLAVAADVPTIHLYGPADPIRFGPWGDPRRQRAISAGMHCPRCGDLSPTRPRGAACMLAIGPDQVLAAARECLDQRPTP
ncbi:MAG TPA: glycosyltransferase family 9 protein, partial [Thermomicrobiales bacterium]